MEEVEKVDHDDTILVREWFNPRDPVHMGAWVHLRKTGAWPLGFIPANVEQGELVTWKVAMKIAEAFTQDFVDQLSEVKP